MIEALACGTPVVAWRNGSVPEVIEDGVTGFVVEGVDEAVAAVRRVGWLDRARCRGAFERRFDAARMARDYLDIYRRLAHDSAEPARQRLVARVSPDWRRLARSPAPLLGVLPCVE
jgi:glycosyltransferase involved in cell wall biosynthesis